MLTQSLTVKLRNGKTREGQVMLPSTFEEVTALLNKGELIELAKAELLKRAKHKLRARPPKTTLRLKLTELTPEQRMKLSEMGLIK